MNSELAMVEIGMGRVARRTFELSEISIVPSRRTRSSQDVSTTWQLDAYRFEIPVLAHPTDALVSPEFAIELGKLGGLGVLNGEGLIGRHADVEAKIAQLVEAASKEPEPSAAIRLLQEFHAAPLNPDLLGPAVARIREAGVTTAVRVSPQSAQALTPVLVQAGIDLLVIQGTIVSAERVASDGEPLNLKTFISELDVPVVAGGVQDHRTALHLMRTGAAGVLVGFGGGSGHTTSDVLGISVPMASAIADVAAARRDYLDESGGRYVHVIADGGMTTSGEITKALALGADAVMIGSPLARAVEAPGAGWHWGAEAHHAALPRGTRMHVGTIGTFEEILQGPARQPDGSMNLVGALRRAMATTGYSELKEFQRVEVVVTP